MVYRSSRMGAQMWSSVRSELAKFDQIRHPATYLVPANTCSAACIQVHQSIEQLQSDEVSRHACKNASAHTKNTQQTPAESEPASLCSSSSVSSRSSDSTICRSEGISTKLLGRPPRRARCRAAHKTPGRGSSRVVTGRRGAPFRRTISAPWKQMANATLRLGTLQSMSPSWSTPKAGAPSKIQRKQGCVISERNLICLDPTRRRTHRGRTWSL